MAFELHDFAKLPRSKVRVTKSTGKVELTLNKFESNRWPNFGEPIEGENDVYCKQSELKTEFREWKLVDRVNVTHDVDRIVFEPLQNNEVFIVNVKQNQIFLSY